jgi:hypothetical protein
MLDDYWGVDPDPWWGPQYWKPKEAKMSMDEEKHEMHSIVPYPAVWTAPKYQFGQTVIVHAHGGESLVMVIGMRFRAASKWEYQVVEMIDSEPDVYCDGRWYIEVVLSEVKE